jgi:hypothetical protein
VDEDWTVGVLADCEEWGEPFEGGRGREGRCRDLEAEDVAGEEVLGAGQVRFGD